jgi:hypothetical protein
MTVTRKTKHWGKVVLVGVALIAGYDWLKGRTKVPLPGGRGKPSAGTVY